MDRRGFVKTSLTVAGSSLLPRRPADAHSPESTKIGYFREKVPEFAALDYEGTRYEDRVPDTLDIAERAKLGINCLTRITDPTMDFEIYWFADFFRNPPIMKHDYSDWCQNVEGMTESLPLLRIASGSGLNSHVDKIWMETLLKSTGPDGLIYVPLEGRPWARMNPAWVTPMWRPGGKTTDISDPSVTQVTNPNLWPRAIAAMMVHYLYDKDQMWRASIEQMIHGMYDLASDQGDYAFFPVGGFEPGASFGRGMSAGEQQMPTGLLALDGGNVRVIQGLATYYRLTGYEPAGTLAKKLVNFIRFRSDAFDPQGRFRCSAFEKHNAAGYARYSQDHGGHLTADEIKGQTLGGHFHAHTIGVLCILEYALAVNDQELIDWCKSSFEWARDQGNSLVGFFPEFIFPEYPSCESCEVADMIGLAAKLSRAGVGDYWDDLDRWTRNQFAENQLTEGDWIYALAETMPKKPVAPNETADQLAKRSIGGFAGYAGGNEFALRAGFQHCCTGNSTRALYYIWQSIAAPKGTDLWINLLLNHASVWADVHSFVPYEGRVTVRMKKERSGLFIRVPEGVESGNPQVAGKVNGATRPLVWDGRYVNLGAVKSDETAELTFPIAQRTVKETLGTVSYSLEMKGSTVISIDPGGKYGALYKRERCRSNQASWRQVDRFAAANPLIW